MRGVSARFAALAAALFLFATGPALAAKCGGDFGTWLAAFKKEAAAAGISEGTLNAALSGVTPSAAILKLDRKQGYFKQSFEKYRAKRVTAAHIRIGKEHLKRSAAFFAGLQEALRRTGARSGGDLGAGDRLRRRHRQHAGHPVVGHAGA